MAKPETISSETAPAFLLPACPFAFYTTVFSDSFLDGGDFWVIIAKGRIPAATGDEKFVNAHAAPPQFTHASWCEYSVLVVPHLRWTKCEGLTVVARLSKREAFYFLARCGRERLSFISENPKKIPTTAYLLESINLRWTTPSSFYYPVRAIRMQIAKRAVAFDTGILNLQDVLKWTSVFSSSGLWLADLWREVRISVPDSAIQEVDTVHYGSTPPSFDQFPKPEVRTVEYVRGGKLESVKIGSETQGLLNGLDPSVKKSLAVSFLHNYWVSKGTTFDTRGEHLNMLGLKLNAKSRKGRKGSKEVEPADKRLGGTVQNLMAQAGVRNKSQRQVLEFFKFDPDDVDKYFADHPVEALEADLTTHSHYEHHALQFLAPILPEAFGGFLTLDEITAFDPV